MLSRKKGFTLVELLIVIVVIGVLSAMMMLSSTEAVSSAKAVNIINNLRNWKTAALEWYADHIDDVDKDDTYVKKFADKAKAKHILPYLGNGLTLKSDNEARDSSGTYKTDHISENSKNPFDNSKNTKGIWLIGYEMDTNDARVKEKLEARADTAGLYWKTGAELHKYTAARDDGNVSVWIVVMDWGSK